MIENDKLVGSKPNAISEAANRGAIGRHCVAVFYFKILIGRGNVRELGEGKGEAKRRRKNLIGVENEIFILGANK